MAADRSAVDDCEINEQYHQIQDKLKQNTIRQSESRTDYWMDTEGTDNSWGAPVGADNSWGAERTGNIASWDVDDAGDADFWGCSDSKEKDRIVLDTGKENAKSGTQTYSLKDVDKTSISSCVQENNSSQAEQSVELTLNQDCNICHNNTGNGATKSNGDTDTADSTSELHETVTDNCPNQSSKSSNDLTKPDSVSQISCKGDAESVTLSNKTKVDSDDKSANEMSLDKDKLENNSECKNVTESSICDKNSTTKLSSETQEGEVIPEMGSREITPPRVHSHCETEDFGETQEGEVIPEKGSREITPPRVHSHCETEDFGDADYLVIDDSDSEEERGFKRVKMTDVVWKPVLKKDPYPVQEPLMLTLDEVEHNSRDARA